MIPEEHCPNSLDVYKRQGWGWGRRIKIITKLTDLSKKEAAGQTKKTGADCLFALFIEIR